MPLSAKIIKPKGLKCEICTYHTLHYTDTYRNLKFCLSGEMCCIHGGLCDDQEITR